MIPCDPEGPFTHGVASGPPSQSTVGWPGVLTVKSKRPSLMPEQGLGGGLLSGSSWETLTGDPLPVSQHTPKDDQEARNPLRSPPTIHPPRPLVMSPLLPWGPCQLSRDFRWLGGLGWAAGSCSKGPG